MREIINKNEKGITLIALVITIIVLLILAGVAISMLSGENGILTQAGKATEEYESASIKEELILKIQEVLLSKYNEDLSAEDLVTEIEGLTKVGETGSLYKYKDETFKISEDLTVTEADEANKMETQITNYEKYWDLSEAQDESVKAYLVNAGSAESSNYVLMIMGTGRMINPNENQISSPWLQEGYEIKAAVIGEGIKNIAPYTFANCESLTSISIPASVTSIGMWTFFRSASLSNIEYKGTIEQWGKVSLSEGWANSDGIHAVATTVVKCTDGNADI